MIYVVEMRGVALVFLAACALLLPASGPARGAPVISVKARTDIRLWPVARQSGGVVIRGELVRRHSQEPVVGELVTVTMNREEQRVRTDGSGVFEARFSVYDGRYGVQVKYAGGPHTASSESEQREIDIGKQDLRLRVTVKDDAEDENTMAVRVRAESQGSGARVNVDLFAGPADELHYVARVATDTDGKGFYALKRTELEGMGRKRIVVKFEGDDAFNPTEAQADIVISLDTQIELSLETDAMAYEAELTAAGRVTDENGKGVADEPVSLKIGARRQASTLTGGDGSFRFHVPGTEIGAGTFNVQAVFEPSSPWYATSRSAVLSVRVAEPQPVPLAHTMAAFGATALAIVAFFGLRTRPWERWLARLRRAGRSATRTSDEAAVDGERAPPPLEGGLRPAHTGLVSNLRRPNDFEFSGTMHDVVTTRPLPGAVVLLFHEGGARVRAVSDARGEFRFEKLDAGRWEAEAGADGYVTERFDISMPHRGDLRGVRIDLLQVRERIFSMYREAAEPLLPEHDKWGVWTPRQIFDHVRAQHPAPALSSLTDFVEETYFSQRIPQESILDDAARRVDAARAEAAAPQGA